MTVFPSLIENVVRRFPAVVEFAVDVRRQGLVEVEVRLEVDEQGSGDIAAHVGTLHYTAQAVINKFGDDIHPGDTFVVNDVYQGGTHFNDTRIVRPIFYKGTHLGFAQANGHWADVGGAVPGSFNENALDHMAEGLRITPERVLSLIHI